MLFSISRRHRLRVVLLVLSVALLAIPGLQSPKPVVAQQRGAVPEDPYLTRQALAMQPLYRSDVADLSQIPRYRIWASFDPTSALVRGELTLRYTNVTNTLLTELVFRLYPNAATIYGGGSLTVTSLECRGRALVARPELDRTILRVPLSPPLWPWESITVNMTFEAQLPTTNPQGYLIFHHSDSVTTLAEWYPILALYRNGWQTPPVPAVGDALLGELAFHEVTLAAPSLYRIASTGVATDTREAKGVKVWTFVSGPARSFSLALSDRFYRESTRVGGVTLNFYALGSSPPLTATAASEEMSQAAEPPAGTAEAALATAREALEAFQRRFGPYPYAELDVVETWVTIKGYEFSSMVFMERGLRSSETWWLYRWTLAHELGHQWWYGLVGSDPVREPWLDESLATYSSLIHIEETRGRAAARAELSSLQGTYGRPSGSGPRILASALDYDGWLSYRGPVYYQGALFIDALRQEMGDVRFFRLLRQYVTKYRYRVATTDDFLSLAESIAGRDLSPLYELWLGTSGPGADTPSER